MKKILFAALAAALFVASCKQSPIPDSLGDAVSFSVYASRAVTKGASNVMSIETLKSEGFGVFAFYTGQDSLKSITPEPTIPNFMDNVKVSFSDGKWSYSPLKYWPNTPGDKVSFFAYAPYASDKAWSSSKINFKVDSLVKNQVDFLFAPGQTDRVKLGRKDSIQFNFKHSLSKIGFYVAYVNDTTAFDADNNAEIDSNTKIVIDTLILQPTNTGFYKEGNLDLKNPGTDWNTAGSGMYKSFVLSAKENFKDTTSATEDRPFGQLVSNKLKQLNDDNSYMMIIPQDLETADSLDVIVKYYVWTKDDLLTEKYFKAPNKVTTNTKINFQKGKEYKINILIGMTSVKVVPIVDSWSVGDTVNVYTPIVTE